MRLGGGDLFASSILAQDPLPYFAKPLAETLTRFPEDPTTYQILVAAVVAAEA